MGEPTRNNPRTADAVGTHNLCEAAATELNAQILVTTSRRTPTDVVEHLSSTLKRADWCPLFIQPDTPSALTDPYQSILALSDLLIVTADSFSMVCEAASSGRPVIVLTLSKEAVRLPKRYKVYAYMEQHAVVRQCRLDGLKQYIVDGLTSDASNTPLRVPQQQRPIAKDLRMGELHNSEKKSGTFFVIGVIIRKI